jgi:hypothetical protein
MARMLWSLRSQSATVIDRWLWPTFVFLSLSWFLPGGVNTWASSVAARQWILGTFVATGLIFELLRGAKSSISLRPLVVTHVPPVLALAFGGWTLVASRESDYQIESLTGSLRYGDSGALWYVGLSLAFVATHCGGSRNSWCIPVRHRSRRSVLRSLTDNSVRCCSSCDVHGAGPLGECSRPGHWRNHGVRY